MLVSWICIRCFFTLYIVYTLVNQTTILENIFWYFLPKDQRSKQGNPTITQGQFFFKSAGWGEDMGQLPGWLRIPLF